MKKGIESSLSEFIPLCYSWRDGWFTRSSAPKFHHLLCIFPCIFFKTPPPPHPCHVAFHSLPALKHDVFRPHLQRAAVAPGTCYSQSSALPSATHRATHSTWATPARDGNVAGANVPRHTYNPRAKTPYKRPRTPERITYARFQARSSIQCSKFSVIFQIAS